MGSVQARAIGLGGTLARVAVAAGLMWLAFDDKRGLTGFVALLGLVVLPGVRLVAQGLRLHFSPAPLRATGPDAVAVNAAIIAALFVLPFPPDVLDAVALFYAASLLVAAGRSYAGCEVLAISNWLLRRDDQVGCPLFWPLDELEARMAGRKLSDAVR